MDMKINKDYVIDQDQYTLIVSYTYSWDNGDYDTPPEDDLEITDVELNGMDITDFYWDLLSDTIDQDVYDHAIENKFN
jgi:hypothetical protein